MNPDCMLPVSPPQFKVTATQGGQCVNTHESLKSIDLTKEKQSAVIYNTSHVGCWLKLWKLISRHMEISSYFLEI